MDDLPSWVRRPPTRCRQVLVAVLASLVALVTMALVVALALPGGA